MPFGDASKILKSNQYQKSDKAPYVLYASLESLIRRIDRYKNIFGKSSTRKAGEHIPWGYSMSTIRIFDGIENMNDI